MSRKYMDNELSQFIELYLDGISYQRLVYAYTLELSSGTFRNYVRRYKLHGITGIKSHKNDRRYSKEFKLKVVVEYLNTDHGYTYLANKYNIPAKTTVEKIISVLP